MRDEYFELLKKHNELERDVRRYFETLHNKSYEEYSEWCDLHEKLSKVGDEK